MQSFHLNSEGGVNIKKGGRHAAGLDLANHLCYYKFQFDFRHSWRVYDTLSQNRKRLSCGINFN